MNSPWGHCDMMAVCAVEYCLGRRSYIVGECVDWLYSIWPALHESARRAIIGVVESAYVRHEQFQERGALGMQMDKEQWDRARKLWRP